MTNRPILFSSWAGHTLVLAVLALGTLTHLNALPNHDVAWLATAATRMLDGGTYQADFFEVNMPLAIAAYIPVHLLQLTGFHLQAAVTVYASALALQSAWLCAYLLSAGGKETASRPMVAASLLIVFLLLPGYEFAEKEHLIAVVALPFICHVSNYRDAIRLGKGLRCYVSILAAIGFFLKPHYALLPFLLLAVRALFERSWKPVFSAEARVLLLAALCYAGLVVARYPDWFTVAQWAADLYGALGAHRWAELFQISGLWIYLVLLGLQIIAFAWISGSRTVLAPFILCALYSWGAYLLQFTGWNYQFLPIKLFTIAGFLPLLAGVISTEAAGERFSRLAGAIGLAGVLLVAVDAMKAVYRQPHESLLEGLPQALSAVAHRGDRIYPFSMQVAPLYPILPLLGLESASRYSQLWPLWELARVEYGFDPERKVRLESRYRQPLVQSVVEDFYRYEPQWVVVDRSVVYPLPPDFNILSMFLADQRFASIWRNYEGIGSVYSPPGVLFDFYRRVQAPSPGTDPTRGGRAPN